VSNEAMESNVLLFMTEEVTDYYDERDGEVFKKKELF